jgi:hypothetical protein
MLRISRLFQSQIGLKKRSGSYSFIATAALYTDDQSMVEGSGGLFRLIVCSRLAEHVHWTAGPRGTSLFGKGSTRSPFDERQTLTNWLEEATRKAFHSLITEQCG